MNRYSGTTTKLQTPFRGIYTHLYWDEAGHLAEVGISHQLKDFDTPIAKMLDSMSEWLNLALKAGLLPILAGGLDEAIKAGPDGGGDVRGEADKHADAGVHPASGK